MLGGSVYMSLITSLKKLITATPIYLDLLNFSIVTSICIYIYEIGLLLIKAGHKNQFVGT